MFSQSADVQSESGGSGAGGGAYIQPSGGGGTPAPAGGGTSAPVYVDQTKKTLTDLYAGYLATIGTGTEGTVDGSLQPLAPQAPGNVLAGRFQTAMSGKAKWVIIAAVVIALIWWWNKRKKSE
jgi:hypothetical protein